MVEWQNKFWDSLGGRDHLGPGLVYTPKGQCKLWIEMTGQAKHFHNTGENSQVNKNEKILSLKRQPPLNSCNG